MILPKKKKNNLKLTPGMILKRGHYLYFAWYWLYGLYWDYRIGKRPLSHTVFNKEEAMYPVQCISYPYLRALLEKVDFQEQDVFVDVGCAWGRMLGFMKYHTKVKRLIGVEYNREAADIAAHIFAGDARIEIIKGDILEHLPLDGTVFYLFNPFGRQILEPFLKQIEEQFTHPVRILYFYPTCKEVLEERRSRWTLVEELEIKPTHLGPLTLSVYALKIEKKDSKEGCD